MEPCGDRLASHAAVETARYEKLQARLRGLPTPSPNKGVGWESPQGDLVLLVAREFIRRVESGPPAGNSLGERQLPGKAPW
jgi:hypothetical protein